MESGASGTKVEADQDPVLSQLGDKASECSRIMEPTLPLYFIQAFCGMVQWLSWTWTGR